MVAAGGTSAPLNRADLLPPEGIDLRAELLAYERDLLLEALDRAGSKRGAARLLGLTQMALYARLRRHDLRVPRDHWSVPEADCVAARAMARAGYSHREIREHLALGETTVSHLLRSRDPSVDQAARLCGLGSTP
jgi:hypothetical protein